MPRSTTRANRSSRDDYELADVFDTGRTEGSTRHNDEDEPPRSSVSRRRSRNEDDDDRSSRRSTARSRSRDEDSDDDDGRERRRASRSEGARTATSTSVGRGRDGLRKHRETRAKASGFPDKFKIDDGEEVIVKFLDDDFFITYYEHQLFDDFKDQKRQKTFVCLGDDCPLCDTGDEPKFFALINVVDLRNPRKPALVVWYATPDPAGKIEAKVDALEDKGKGAINDPDKYYMVTKKKKYANSPVREYSLELVKARDLVDDYDVDPLSDSELAEFGDQAFTEDVVRINKRSDLLDIADKLSE